MSLPNQATPSGPDRRSVLAGGASLALGLGAGCRGPSEDPDRPQNILLIVVDQQRADAIGTLGHPLARTPHLDRFLQESVRITDCYAAVPLCAPARQSLVTGLPASYHGTFRNRHARVEGEETLLSRATAQGWHTLWVGKTHCNVEGLSVVRSQSDLLDAWRELHPGGGLPGAEVPRTTSPAQSAFLDPYNPGLLPAGPGARFQMEEHVSTSLLDLLRQRPSGRPFCAVASYLSPHPPLFPPEAQLAPWRTRPVQPSRDYRSGNLALPDELKRRRRVQRFARVTDPMADAVTRAYYASLEWTDHCVGQLLEGMRALDLLDDTLVIYTSDHGEQLGEHGLFGKRTFYEGSARVPLAIRPPGGLAAPETRERVVSHLDLAETLRQWLAVEGFRGAPGRDLRPLLEGRMESPWHDRARLELSAAYSLPNPEDLRQQEEGSPPPGCFWALRQGPWKLVDHGSPGLELFHIEEDPEEGTNRAGDPALASLIAEMQQVLREGSPAEWAFHMTDDGQTAAPR